MPLKGIKPEAVKPSKPKFMISGRSGAGKTFFALNFERAYYIDTEVGATRDQYIKKLAQNGGAYFGKEQGSQDFKAVIEEIKLLATTKHDYKTIVIDSFSKLYNTAAAVAEEEVGNDYGKDKKEANKPTRQLMRWIEKVDMTVILICHYKDKWERKGKEMFHIGGTFDGYDKLEFDLDLWCEIKKTGKQRDFLVKKSRIDSFIEGNEYPLNYERFVDMYGKEAISSPTKQIVLATPEQVQKLKQRISLVKLDEDLIRKWLKAADAETFEEMTSEQVEKAIAHIDAKFKETANAI